MTDSSREVVLTVPVRDGQYHLRSAPGVDNMWPGTQDGIFVGEDNWVAVLCGTDWGPVELTVRVLPEPPDSVDARWDMAAEWTLDGLGHLQIHDTYNTATVADLDVPEGWIRLRLSARDRSLAAQAPEQPERPTEHHQLEIWPVSERLDPAVVLGPDDHARTLL
ncbi:hypothetical protein [Amycolatopsis sp. FDAARGOS 1241]|uniref:hypothetical protein n=1 Tax=Amycolatopsis sp. FDAARGOS 1241 TaxID=2778070 RepID=UPI001950E3CB|nr:hypothetical protein [Amycolatopsis sp. FDAARGOS 1241]QRP47934.1 hypothetical protein I6J71_08555 [Amycolatopsis sp. FDAARGOS 1241]